MSQSSPRESWFVRSFFTAASELRHAGRLFCKNRVLASITVLTLALCIGANTAIFSVVYPLMLKPLPFSEPHRVVEIYNTYKKAGLSKLPSNLVQYVDYKENAESFDTLGLWAQGPVMFGEEATAERLWGTLATSDIFDVLRVRPVLGRFFSAENSLPGENRVVVLTWSFWHAHYREDPNVIGRSVVIDGRTETIIGVAPRPFEVLDARVRFVRPLVWERAKLNAPLMRHTSGLRLWARLRAGVSIARAHAEADMLERRYLETTALPLIRNFIADAGHKIGMGSVQTEQVAPLRMRLHLLQGGALFVLLIGCVNVANLLLARTNARESELAIRFALGASRPAIARQLLAETLLLAGLGAIIGLGCASAAIAGINRYTAELLPGSMPFRLDAGVLGFTVALSLIVAILITLLPLVHVLRSNPIALIQRNSRSSSGALSVRRWSTVLVVAQVAFALMLLAGAGLLIQSLGNALAVNPGFDPKGIVVGQIALPAVHRRTDDAARAIRERIAIALQEIPGIASVAASIGTPFRGGLPVNAVQLLDNTVVPGAAPSAYRVVVTPSYAETLQLTVIEGRFYEPGDLAPEARPVFVVDETFARRYFPGRSAIGGRFVFGVRPDKEADWATVVGVVRNVPHNGVEERSGVPFAYQLMAGRPSGFSIFLRTPITAPQVIQSVREKLRALDPAIALFETGALEFFIDESFKSRRLITLLLAAFAILAVFLSAIGIYGVLTYDVLQRTREIGVRSAIGASRTQVIGLIMRQGLWKTGAGLAIGLVGAVLLSGYLRSLLFEVQPTDTRAYAVVSVLVFAVAALASYLPARRAATIDPVEALRAE